MVGITNWTPREVVALSPPGNDRQDTPSPTGTNHSSPASGLASRNDSVIFVEKSIPTLSLSADRIEDANSTWMPLCDMIAAVDPARPAIRSPELNLSYGELMRIVDRLAQRIQTALRPPYENQIIPICFEESPWAIISMLSIHRAGAAFVTLDKHSPTANIENVLKMTEATLVIASRTIAKKRAESLKHQKVIFAAEVDSDFAQAERPLVPASTDRLAYCLTTSGSTGLPKGVLIRQEAMAHSITAHSHFFGITPDSKVLQLTSLVFDPCLTEIYGCLLNGACLYIPKSETRFEGLDLYVSSMGINWAFLTPSFALSLDASRFPSLATLVLGGEAVTQECAERWVPQRRVINGYGPTECCCFCYGREIPTDCNSPSTIGRPIGCEGFLVDPEDHSKLVPAGSEGELVIRGSILADGYLGDPTRTAAAFVQFPVRGTEESDKNGQIMYKTGDICRLNPNGDMEYIGRKDSQVKLRGQRIELKEIEMYLQRLDQSRVFVVDVIKSPIGGSILAAFYTAGRLAEGKRNPVVLADESRSETVSRWRDSLGAVLAHYKIPNLYLYLERIPLSLSGKVDRKALRHLGQTWQAQQRSSPTSSVVAKPRSKNAEIITNAWSRASGVAVENIDPESSVLTFSDSITGLRALSYLRTSGFSLSFQDVLRARSIHELAELVGPAKEPAAASDSPNSGAFGDNNFATTALLQQASKSCNIDLSQIQDVYPCTPLQASLVALSSARENAFVATYHFRLPKGVIPDLLRHAWNTVIAANPILRTRIFVDDSHKAWQAIVAADVDSILDDTHEIPIGAYGQALHHVSLDTNEDVLKLRWDVHHSIYDGGCLWDICRDVSILYTNQTTPAPGRPPFSAFVNYLAGRDYDAAKSFWQTSLGGFQGSAYPPLPHQGYEVDVKNQFHFAGRRVRSRVPGITDSSLMRAACGLSLRAFHDANDDVVFGVTIDGRHHALQGIEHIFGPTLSTIPFRVQLDSSRTMTVERLLSDVQNMSISLLEHGHVGVADIRSFEPKSPALVAATSFQTLFVVQRPGAHDVPLYGEPILLSQETLAHSTENIDAYPLTVEVTLENEDTWSAVAHFDNKVISEELVESFMRHFSHMLVTLGEADPLAPCAQLPNVPVSDLNLLRKWNELASVASINSTLHDKIDEVAIHLCDKPAVVSGAETLTYAQLMDMTDRLATWLLQNGCGCGELVVLGFEKTIWSVVGMISAMKAGAGFVPLDMGHPPARHAEIIAQTQPSIILTSRRYAHNWPDNRAAVVDATSIAQLCAGLATKRNIVDPREAAYVLFTSGSTGRPKGVVIQHSAILTSLYGLNRYLQVDETTRGALFASYAFDASIFEIFMTLLVGGTVCVLGDEERLDGFAAACSRMNVNFSLLTPTFLRTLLPADVPTLKKLCTGGEAIDEDLIKVWKNSLQLYNCYGPTETSIIATMYPYSEGEYNIRTIGRPTSGPAWIVRPDDHTQLVPLGVAGELVVGGSLARGYLNDSVKTNAAFVDSSGTTLSMTTSSRTGRIYKTGDLCQMSRTGEINYLGRIDTQVKIRGQRLEIGEIETLLRHESVGSAIVVYPRCGPLEKRLVACFTFSSHGERNSHQLNVVHKSRHEAARQVISECRATIQKKLPTFMIPTAWAPIDQLPVQASHKTDRKAVTTWVENLSQESADVIDTIAHDDSEDIAEYQAPATEVELMLQQIWCRALNLSAEKVPVDRGFYSLQGADSIVAMQIVSLARQRRLKITVRDLLVHSTISRLGKNVTFGDTIAAAPDPRNIHRPFPLSPVQMWYASMAPTEKHYFNQSFLLHLQKPESADALRNALNLVIQRHEMLRARALRNPDGTWSQIILKDNSSFSFQHHSHAKDWNELLSIIGEAEASLDLINGPIFRADMIEIDSEEYLFLVVHHFFIDLVSWRIVLRDLEEILAGQNPLHSDSHSFQEWCSSQEMLLRLGKSASSTMERPVNNPFDHRAFWGLTSKDNSYASATRHAFSLDMQTSQKLLAISKGTDRPSITDVFLASIGLTFRSHFPERPAPTVFCEGHGRQAHHHNLDISDTVGWFTTLYPISLQASEGQDLHSLTSHVHALRQAQAYDAERWFAAKQFSSSPLDGVNIPEILFNFTGSFQSLESSDSLFRKIILEEGDLLDMSPNMPRFALFDISVDVVDGCLSIAVIHNKQMARQDTIQTCFVDLKQRLTAYAAEDLLTPAFMLPSLTPEATRAMLGSVKGSIEDVSKVSSIQKIMLGAQTMNNEVYIPRLVLEMTRSDIAEETIASAWQHIVERYPSLRTVFRSCNDELYQIVTSTASSTISVASGNEIWTAQRALETQCLDLSQQELPHRLRVFPRSDGRSLLLLEMSHAIVDAATMGNILDDLSSAMQGVLQASDNEIPYTLYARDQSARPSIEARQYWGKLLQSSPPTVIGKADLRDSDFVQIRKVDLKAFTTTSFASHGTNVPAVVRFAWATALGDHLNRPDILFKTVVSTRSQQRTENQKACGPCITFLPCRIILDRTQALHAQTFEHQVEFLSSLDHQAAALEIECPEADTIINIRTEAPEASSHARMFNLVDARDPFHFSIVVEIDLKLNGAVEAQFTYWRNRVDESMIAELDAAFVRAMHAISDDLKSSRVLN